MSPTILLIVLLYAHISGLISEQLLSAAVGGSVLIPCSLPGYPLSQRWFYWQDDWSLNLLCHWDSGNTLPGCDKYKGRFQVFNSGFSSGNTSLRLDNISPEDDQKTFFAFVHFYDEQKKVAKLSEQRCRSILQVSAPYQNLVLTVKDITNSATCSPRGGYPAAQVSWKGLNRSSDEEQDLQDAETFLKQDPTEKIFSITSSVSLTGLKSVTCVVYNPHSHETRTRTEEINTAENERIHVAAIAAPFVLALVILILAGVIAGAVWFYVRYKSQRPVPVPEPVLEQLNPEPDVLNLQDAVQEEAPDLNPDAAREPVDLNPQDPVQEEAPAQDQDQAEDPPNRPPVNPNVRWP
ncbi:uncharacterized protein LOC115588024 [Sparus aurata]|uniref:uncharacterized protein LOC115588024 n=1 Tax=Sparus aurata TaxID=8175 RepID=UPI0011C18B4E|nr:uncharacterized protein LOC115588024 [Sparus aurata]